MTVGGAIIGGIITVVVGSTTSEFIVFVSFSKLGSFFKTTFNCGLDFERGLDCDREVVDEESLDDEEDEDEDDDKDLLRDREVCALLRLFKDVEDDRDEDDFDLSLRLRLCECES